MSTTSSTGSRNTSTPTVRKSNGPTPIAGNYHEIKYDRFGDRHADLRSRRTAFDQHLFQRRRDHQELSLFSGAQKTISLPTSRPPTPARTKSGRTPTPGTQTKTRPPKRSPTARFPVTAFSTGATGYDYENRVTAWNRTDSNQNQTWNLSLVGDWNTFNQTGTTAFTQTRTHGPTHEFTSFTGTTSGTLTYDTKGNYHASSDPRRPRLELSPGTLTTAWLVPTPTAPRLPRSHLPIRRPRSTSRPHRIRHHNIYFPGRPTNHRRLCRRSRSSSPTYRYVYGYYIDEPVMRETASGNVKHFYHRNQQYSITGPTDNSWQHRRTIRLHRLRRGYEFLRRFGHIPNGFHLWTFGTQTPAASGTRASDCSTSGQDGMSQFGGRLTNRDPLGF